MSRHQNNKDVGEIWNRFQDIINWAKTIFPRQWSSMTSVDWGSLYDHHHNRSDLDPVALEAEVMRLHKDDDVKRKPGIYPYLLTGDEKHLNIRVFSPAMREAAYERQGGICPHCKKTFQLKDMHADHIDPWSEGGPTVAENCQMLCSPCNRRKGAK